jgi:glycosyltransferase involved in cell wall biosynthesis
MITEDGDRDGIPNVLVEGAACGVPVVSTPVSGIPELVQHEHTGLVVPPGDASALAAAIERLFDEDELCERLRSGARDLVEREFDLRRNAGVIAGELTDVMEAHTASLREAREVPNHK